MIRVMVTAAAAVAAAALIAGCSYLVPSSSTSATPSASGSSASPGPSAPSGASASPGPSGSPGVGAGQAFDERLADAPPLLVQCAADRAGLRPSPPQSWFAGGKVTITESNAGEFVTWWRTHNTIGPYPQTFVIDGHRTHYLAFGVGWILRNGEWLPADYGPAQAQAISLGGWSQWAATNDKLPPAVCGRSASARVLQAQVYAGAADAGNPWGT